MADEDRRRFPPPNRRRDKPQLSCNPCRQRKLRCNREQPCGACSRRGLTSSCSYATTSGGTPDSKHSNDVQHSTAPQPATNSLQGRISELESLVVTLMQDHTLPISPAPTSQGVRTPSSVSGASEIRKPRRSSDESMNQADPGTLTLRESGASYVQSVHWEAILAKIRGLKEDLGTDVRVPRGSHLFYGPNRHATRDEILQAVPPRSVVDRLMALHFDSSLVTPYLIHRKKFLQEYEAFWTAPSATSIAWLGLMFSMLCLTAQLQTFAIDSVDGRSESLKAECAAMKHAFRERAVQCLILARYTTGGPYILETLVMILTGEFVLLKESATDGWLLISTIFHIAMRMGYHRDPSHFPDISPFDGEMRRRVWATILQLDLTLSLETGLPRSATVTHIDTKEPRNLRDSDFDEDTTAVPAPRPETEWTPILPLIARWRLISALGLICDVNTDINPPSYKKITEVDTLLADVHNHAIPPILRWKGTASAITDSPNIVVQRISVETTYYKSRILLHRRALINCTDPSRRRPDRVPSAQDQESVKICLTSALKILSFQEMLHEEAQPFGRLSQLRWKVAHIFNQDVLLATSVLCLYLQDVDKFEASANAGLTAGKTTAPAPPSARAVEVRRQLTTSHGIWLAMSTSTASASAEATKVARALSVVLGLGTQASMPPQPTADDIASVPSSYDMLSEFDPMPVNDYGAMFNHQYFPSGFYSPLTFFDNLLEGEGGKAL